MPLAARQTAAVRQYCQQVARELEKRCTAGFRGRILEIGAGGAWLSAELSKLPRVVEVVAADFEPEFLRDHAPEVFTLLQARSRKITRVPLDSQQLEFPAGHFDFVICAGTLRRGLNVPQLLRECRRVLKPGGCVVALPDALEPLQAVQSAKPAPRPSPAAEIYTLTEYKDFFRRAGFTVSVSKLEVAGRLRYYYDKLVRGVVHARIAIVGTKPSPK